MLIVVVGTGTGIGKTHVGCAVARAGVRRGWVTAGRKPIESGVIDPETTDAAALARSGSLRADRAPPYVFAEPVSPHLAARRAGVDVDVDVAAAWVRSSSTGADLILAETAGGLLSPLGRSVTNLDLALSLRPDALLLVAPDRLGVLHEVGSARAVLPASLWSRTVVILAAPGEPDASTGSNRDELLWLGWTSHAVEWARHARDGEPILALATAVSPAPTRA